MEARIKITYIIDTLNSNLAGTENQLIKLINGLNKKEFAVQLICLQTHPWFEAYASSLQCTSAVVGISRLKAFSSFLKFLKLVTLLRNNRPDVVHTFFPASNILGVLAASMAGIKNILSSRRDYGEWMNSRYLLATRFANKFATKIVANSHMVEKLTVIKENVKEENIKVIYNGIDTKLFKITERDHLLKSKLNIPSDHKIAGIVANFRPMKRQFTFIRAAHEILRTRRDVSFLLIGRGPLQEEIERLAQTLKVDRHIYFAGVQTEILPFLSILDVGVNCSDGEGLSNAVMEYMAAGVPCVVSNAGGNPDLITHEVNGCVFELDDYKTLARLILKLMDDSKMSQQFARNAKEKIEKEMRLDVILSKYERFYQTLVNT
jgi:glycosyltransferase involved in cell wall biosynthesis